MNHTPHVMCVFGTRPDAVKMCPLVLELQRRSDLRTTVTLTAQHREMLGRRHCLVRRQSGL